MKMSKFAFYFYYKYLIISNLISIVLILIGGYFCLNFLICFSRIKANAFSKMSLNVRVISHPVLCHIHTLIL